MINPEEQSNLVDTSVEDKFYSEAEGLDSEDENDTVLHTSPKTLTTAGTTAINNLNSTPEHNNLTPEAEDGQLLKDKTTATVTPMSSKAPPLILNSHLAP